MKFNPLLSNDENQFGIVTEISSPISRIIDSSKPDDIKASFEEVIINNIDFPPLWINHLLTKRRPSFAELAMVVDMIHVEEPYRFFGTDDFAALIKVSIGSNERLMASVVAIITSEATYVGGQIGYWIKFQIYGVNEIIGEYISRFRSICTYFETLAVPDGEILGQLKFREFSLPAIASYQAHEQRTLPLFVIGKHQIDSENKRLMRYGMARALLPFGVVGCVPMQKIREMMNKDYPSNAGIAIAYAPGEQSSQPSVVLETYPEVYGHLIDLRKLEIFLKSLTLHNPRWESDDYVIPPLSPEGARQAKLEPGKGPQGLADRPFKPILAKVIDTITSAPGWDLYSPLPVPAVEKPKTDQENPEADTAETGRHDLSDMPAPIEQKPIRLVDGYPADIKDIGRWAKQNFEGRITIARRALKEAKKVYHPDPARIAKAIELLAGPKLDMFRGKREAGQAFFQGLLDLRMRDGFSNAEIYAGKSGSNYSLPWKGQTLLLDKHLASFTSGFNDPRMIRIYYAYDQQSDEIVVGWFPTHLKNSLS